MPVPALTPAKHPFLLPHDALTHAISQEWEGCKAFVAAKMPLTTLAYTAIDRIVPQQGKVIEALGVYADTDTLCYRAPEEALAARQRQDWDPLVSWSGSLLGSAWQLAEGIMPLDQSPALHAALRTYLAGKNGWELAAFSVLAGGYSSLILAQAVVERYRTAQEAFTLSRLEEEHCNEQWGRDAEAEARAARILEEMLAAERFLRTCS